MSKEVGSFKVGDKPIPVLSYVGEVISVKNNADLKREVWIKNKSGNELVFEAGKASVREGHKVEFLVSEHNEVITILAVVNHSTGTVDIIGSLSAKELDDSFGIKDANSKAFWKGAFKWALIGLPILFVHFEHIKIFGDGPMILFVVYEMVVPMSVGGPLATRRFVIRLAKTVQSTAKELATKSLKDS